LFWFWSVRRPCTAGSNKASQTPPWFGDWGVEEGFAISVDTEGYSLPSAIAFVPEPGDGPKDPLYFVTELRGKIKVVTNDRTIYTFAQNFFQSDQNRELEKFPDEIGLTGICLDPMNGHVFATFSYALQDKGLRNNIARFETQPGEFGLQPTGVVEFPDVFRNFPTDASHQIGGCQVVGDFLFAGVGDGFGTEELPIGIASPLGKILRFDPNGQPAQGNPFNQDNDITNPANYVWALGFRNPFGIKAVGDELFVADNGGEIDRLVQVERGKDYLWDGTDASIGARANVVIVPSIAPVQIDFSPLELDFFPIEYRGNFFLSASGVIKGINRVPYDIDQRTAARPSKQFLSYLGTGASIYFGMVAGLSLGSDGLYFAPVLENREAGSAVYRIRYDPMNEHPYREDDVSNPEILMTTLGCKTCHTYNGQGGTLGPSLNYDELLPRLEERLVSPEYLASLDEIDQIDEEPYTIFRGARQSVREQQGIRRIQVWIKNRIIEPKFDNPDAQMPNLDVSSAQAIILAEFLTRKPPDGIETMNEAQSPSQSEEMETDSDFSLETLTQRIRTNLPSLRYRYLPLVFLAGALAGVVFIRWFERRAKP
jgi:hypothetical protein